jgi:hypothetical protein
LKTLIREAQDDGKLSTLINDWWQSLDEEDDEEENQQTESKT